MKKKNHFRFDKEYNVKLNGYKQNFRVMTDDKKNPIILFVHGGPGACDRYIAIEQQAKNLVHAGYTMVVWDQRGAGKSFSPRIFLDRKLCIEDYIEDAHQLILFLLKEFDQEQIILFGRSWGTVLGSLVCQKYPELIRCYLAQGQFVEGCGNEAISWQFAYDEAKKAGDDDVVAKLEKCKPENGLYPTSLAMGKQRSALSKYGGAHWNDRSGYFTSVVKPFMKNDGYEWYQLPQYAIGGFYLSSFLWPQVVAHDFMKEIPELKMPVLLTIGRHDYNTPFELAEPWFNQLKAPVKKWVWFEESAHSPVEEEPELWCQTVLAFLKENLG